MDTSSFKTEECWLEECLGCTESLITNGDHLSIGQFVAPFECRGLSGCLEFLLKVESDIAEFLFNIPHNFALGGGGEGVTPLHQVLDQEVSQVTTGKIKTKNRVRERETLVDGHSVRNTITRIEHDTSSTTRGVEREHSLNSNVESRGIESLEHDLSHLFTIRFGVKGSLGEKDGMLFWSNAELIVEGVMPYFFHIVPIGDDTMFDGVLQSKNTSLRLGFISKRLSGRT